MFLACLGWAWVVLAFFRPADRPRSVLSHGLGNRVAKLGHGTVVFRVRFFFALPMPPSAPSRRGGQGNLVAHTVAQDCVLFCFYFLCYACHFVLSLLCVFSWALPLAAGLWDTPCLLYTSDAAD